MGEESILLLVQGKVLAGVDLSELKPGDVTVQDTGGVYVRLTPPHIQEAYLDEKYTKVWGQEHYLVDALGFAGCRFGAQSEIEGVGGY